MRITRARLPPPPTVVDVLALVFQILERFADHVLLSQFSFPLTAHHPPDTPLLPVFVSDQQVVPGIVLYPLG